MGYKQHTEYFIAVEGMYTGQFVYAGSKATLTVGNVIPVNCMPEGTIISNVEAKMGDRGSLARASGTSAIIIGHTEDGKKTRIRMPSGMRKAIQGTCRAMVGVVAGGQRTEMPPAVRSVVSLLPEEPVSSEEDVKSSSPRSDQLYNTQETGAVGIDKF